MAIIAKSKITSCFSVMTFWRFVFLILQWVPGANIYYKVDANLGVLFQIQIRQIVTFGPTWKLFWILLSLLFGSSHPEMFYEKGVLKNFNFNFIKKEILPQVFSCNFFKILRKPLLIEHLRSPLHIIVNFNTNIRHTFKEQFKHWIN